MTLNKDGKQTRLGSFLEVSLNVVSGFIISMLVWTLLVAPLFNYDTSHAQSFWITFIFTVTSMIRSFIFRRIFNHYQGN